jgi:hypothetical protein
MPATKAKNGLGFEEGAMLAMNRILLAAVLFGLAAPAAVATPSSRLSLGTLDAKPATPAGVASIRCTLADAGALTGCTVVNEAPLGMGLGEAALKMSREVKLPGGQPGQVVTIPLRFILAPGQAGATATP